jgi:DUF2892 family protein
MNSLIHFMNSTGGRALRVLLGLVLIYAGLVTLSASTVGIIVAIIGLLPIIMGFWGHCLLEFLFPQAKHA